MNADLSENICENHKNLRHLRSELRPYRRAAAHGVYFHLALLVILLLIVVGGSGCSAPPDPVAEVRTLTTTATATIADTPTPLPSPTVTPTPSPTPTPTPSPSPTPLPLAQARQWRNAGDLEAAIEAYQRFLDEHPSSPLTAEAQFELAKTWLAAGDARQAIPLLEALTADGANLTRIPEALYWLGKAYQPLDASAAAAAFLRYAEYSPHLKTEALLTAADAYLAAADIERATAVYEQALAQADYVITALRAHEGLATVALRADRPQDAIPHYRAILDRAQAPAYRTEILYRLGQAQEASGQVEAAWQSYQRALHEDSSSWYAYQALIALVDAGQPVPAQLRAEIDINAGAYFPAIRVLTELLAKNPADAGTLQALLAQAYEGLGNYEAAAAAWQQVLAYPGDAATQKRAWLGWGRSLWRQGQQEAAREVYLRAAAQLGDTEVAATALWWAAVLAGQEDDQWRQAADDFMRLARDFPQSSYADQAGFRAGLIYYRLGDVSTARDLWAAHADTGDGPWQAAAHYWLGKLLWQSDQQSEALAHWQETARRWDESDFYGVRARQRLREAGRIIPSLPHSGDDISAAQNWALRLPGAGPASTFRQPPAEFARIDEWHRLGEDAFGHRELASLQQVWQKDPVRLLQLALFARDLRYYDLSIRAASQLVSVSGQPLTAAPAYVQRLVYPRYYDALILSAARDFDLDPALYYALIRQESLFWAPAASHAGAQGLAQIMPATGQSAAQQLGLNDFSNADLKRPQTSLYLGAYILSEELRRSGQNVFRALAAYNAGPGNAAFWWQLAENDPDLFVELIAFAETQRYVRTITIQAQHYRRLYPDLSPQ